MDFAAAAHGRSDALPLWAAPLETAERMQCLIETAHAVLRARFGQAHLNRPQGTFSIPDGPVVGLGTIARLAADIPPERWRLLVYDVVSCVDQLSAERIAELFGDWERVAPLLRVRVFGVSATFRSVDPPVRPLGPGTAFGLGVALDSAMATVTRSHLEAWPVDEAEAFERGAANLDLDPTPIVEMADFEGVGFALVSGEGLAVTGHANNLHHLLPELRDDPVAVVAPAAHLLLVHAVGGPTSVRDLLTLRMAAGAIAATGGNPISLDVLRYSGPGRLDWCSEWSPPLTHPSLGLPARSIRP